MRILHVFNSRIKKHGSFEDFMIELAGNAKRNNLHISFVFPEINTREVKQKLNLLGAKIFTIEYSWKSFAFLIKLTNIILKEKPMIVDFHFCSSINFLLLFLILRASGIKVAYHYHGEITPIENLRFANRHFSKLRLSALFVNKIICVSEANKRFLEALNIRKKIDVVYNGVNVKAFQSMTTERSFKREMNFTNGELIVFSMASLIPRKGIAILIKAAKDVIDEIPNARFVLVGGGDKKPYQKLAEDLGISEKIVFTGLLKEYPYHILKDTDLYVSASFAESFGLSTAEAQLMGIPAVATKVGGVPEVVSDGNSGILVPSGDSRRLALEITKLLKDRKLRTDLGNFGKKWITAKFNLEDRVEELINVYAS
ncbi:MAG: glycosyltransferase family 4 protein [Candidatus Omnitrophica bacterium]|nr:glycosyltransferase family 4 protein [Candidatus Omnitrophota bacterium]